MGAQIAPISSQLPTKRIGLALSGGGFRASIFHLGVIRHLDELHAMKDVNVISAVSGGSVLAAFYACERSQTGTIPPPE
jgi:predicted acylesterase/phospholipase RssA